MRPDDAPRDVGVAGVAAIVGVFVAAACLVFLVVAVIVVQSADDDPSVFELGLGDCVARFDDVDGDVDTVPVVDCADEHVGEVVDVGELNPDGDREYPGAEALFIEIEDRCRTALVPFLDAGIDPNDYAPLPIAPDEASWSTTGGRYSCIALQRDGTSSAPLADGG